MDLYTRALDFTPNGDLIVGAGDSQFMDFKDIRLVKLKTGLNINVSELEETGVSIFPNPATEVLNLNLSEFDAGRKVIRVLDSSGKLVLESAVNSTIVEIEVNQFVKGIYTCVIYSETEMATVQFSKN
jgi:hypothetical protein